MGALLGDDVVHAEVGDLVFKPRNQWHTFWNAGDGPCRILEIISPGGFEHCFDQMAAAMASPAFDPQQMAELAGHFGLEIRPDSIPEAVRRARTHAPDAPGQPLTRRLAQCAPEYRAVIDAGVRLDRRRHLVFATSRTPLSRRER
jgi:cupin domain